MQSTRKKILAICGSTRKESVNLHILEQVAGIYAGLYDWHIFNELDQLPHFNPDLDNDQLPGTIAAFREQIANADGVLICTPEYVYSLPGSLKNAIEWTVSTTLFTNKPTALITASSSGVKGFEALELLMNTITGTTIDPSLSLLIQAPKTKLTKEGKIVDQQTLENIHRLINAFGRRMTDDK